MIKIFSGTVSNSPTAFSQFLNGLDFAFGLSKEIVIVGNKGDAETKKMLNLIQSKFIPGKILLVKDPNKEDIAEIAEFTKNQKMIGGKITVYICENYICKMPVNDLKKLKEHLE